MATQNLFGPELHKFFRNCGFRGHSKTFARAGAQVYVFGRTLASLEEAAVGSANITPVACDVADRESVAAAVAKVCERGAPFVLVHTAGINTPDRFMTHPDPSKIASGETWERVLEINIMGVVNMLNAVTPLMAAAGGVAVGAPRSHAVAYAECFARVPRVRLLRLPASADVRAD